MGLCYTLQVKYVLTPHMLTSHNKLIIHRNGKGSFTTLSSSRHLPCTAIEGSVKIPDLHDKPTPTTVGGLSVAVASVSIGYFAHRVILMFGRWRGH